MPLFICEKCDAIDNTACGGTFWTHKSSHKYFDGEDAGKALCVECAPTKFHDGSTNTGAGKWHNRFEKKFATQEMVDAFSEDMRRNYVGLGRFGTVEG